MGPHHAGRIVDLLDRVDLGSQVVAVEEVAIEEDVAVPRRGSSLTAWVNASFGCDEACTYCVVPRTRGREQSRKPDDVKARGEGGGGARRARARAHPCNTPPSPSPHSAKYTPAVRPAKRR